MKRLLSLAVIISMVALACKKNDSKNTNNNTICPKCSSTLIFHPTDSDSLFYYVPTAFTPNGDGINDVFMIYATGLVTDSSTQTIWDMNGNEVFSGTIAQRWDGRDKNGHACPAGQYPVSLHLLTAKNYVTQTCACVTILKYSGSCINTNHVTYYFPDQVNMVGGSLYPTNDKICP